MIYNKSLKQDKKQLAFAPASLILANNFLPLNEALGVLQIMRKTLRRVIITLLFLLFALSIFASLYGIASNDNRLKEIENEVTFTEYVDKLKSGEIKATNEDLLFFLSEVKNSEVRATIWVSSIHKASLWISSIGMLLFMVFILQAKPRRKYT